MSLHLRDIIYFQHSTFFSRDQSDTVEVPKSSHSRRISPEQVKSLGYDFIIMEIVSFDRPSPMRKVECTNAIHDPAEITPLSKYVLKFGTLPLLNHLASSRNASNMSIHCTS